MTDQVAHIGDEDHDKFTLDEVMSRAFDDLKSRFWKFLGLLSLAFFIMMLPGFASFSLQWLGEKTMLTIVLGGVLSLVSSLLSMLMTMGMLRLQLNIVRGEAIHSNDLWKPIGRIWAFMGGSILLAIMLGLGFLCFIVPGIILYLTFQFYPYFIIEHKMGPIAALNASAAITKGVKWELFFLHLVLMVVGSMGWLLLVIGAIPAEMFCRLTITHAYADLLKRCPKENLAELPALAG